MKKEAAKVTTIILPGIGDSGSAHWQSLWQAENPAFRRFAPDDWDRPQLDDWLAALERAIDEAMQAGEGPPLLVAHSLACLLVAHGPAGLKGRVRGAFLVAPPDPQAAAFPAEAASFVAVPRAPLPFPALVVASSDDPYADLAYAQNLAADWRAGFVEAGALGHINAASGVGDWKQGRNLLTAFSAGLGAALKG